MERLEQYQQIVQELLLDYAQRKPIYGDIEVVPIFDCDRHHYQVMHMGWQGPQLVHSIMIHIDIKGDKVWLQWNATEREVAEELVEAGIPKDHIVLGFHSAFMRQFSSYAVS